MIKATTLFRITSSLAMNCIFAITFSLAAMADQSISGLQHNNKAIEHLENENLNMAEQSLLMAMAEDPNSPIPHMNLGLIYELGKNFEKAIKEYELVLRYTNLPDELKFAAHFNAGNAAAQNEDIDKALTHYQAALAVQPDSVETKTNIELLFKGGSGKGKGKNKNKNKNKNDKGEGEGESDQQEQPQNQGQNEQEQPEKKEKPKFNSENLTKEDVRKILEELKNQEQRIRALDYGAKSKEKSPEKDW